MSEQRKELMHDRNSLPSRYWEYGWEDMEEEPDENYIPNYEDDELPFE